MNVVVEERGRNRAVTESRRRLWTLRMVLRGWVGKLTLGALLLDVGCWRQQLPGRRYRNARLPTSAEYFLT